MTYLVHTRSDTSACTKEAFGLHGNRIRRDTIANVDIAAFLRARIADDEYAAQQRLYEIDALGADWPPTPRDIADFNRVLRECSAKRRVVELALELNDGHRILWPLAWVYADHRDFDPGWATS